MPTQRPVLMHDAFMALHLVAGFPSERQSPRMSLQLLDGARSLPVLVLPFQSCACAAELSIPATIMARLKTPIDLRISNSPFLSYVLGFILASASYRSFRGGKMFSIRLSMADVIGRRLGQALARPNIHGRSEKLGWHHPCMLG
jgi:hypothetical protein